MMESREVTLEVLTALHIRAGNLTLRAGWDFVADRERVFVLDLDRIYTRLWRGGADIPRPEELLRGRNPEPFARYVLELAGERRGVPELWPVIRDPVTAKPFIPGSTLKGLIRTAVAWALFGGALNLGPKAGQADDRLEEGLFGPNPHADVLRVMRVSDLMAVGECREWAAPVELYALNSAGRLQARPELSSGVVEAVAAGAVFKGTVSLDLALLGQADKLKFNRKAVEALRAWPQVLGEFGLRLLDFQTQFYRQGGLTQVADRLAALRGRGGSVACLGWGGGWPSKTVGLKLTPPQVEQVARQYNLGRWRSPHFPDRFPISRRLIRLPGGLVPLGWVSVRMGAALK